jgi:hypothetical protein
MPRCLKRAWAVLAVAGLCGACTQEPDVVADVQLHEVDASVQTPVAGQSSMMPAMDCVLSPWFFDIDEAVNQNDCKFKLAPELLAWINAISAAAQPPMGEVHPPTPCEAADQPFYIDPKDGTQVIACEAACNAIRQWLLNERARYQACTKAAQSASAP